MSPIVSVVGKSDSGKTYLVERLVPLLKAKGYRIATVKHDVHGFEIDREGKDSWRHKQAGASMVVLSSPQKIAVIKDLEEEQNLEEIRNLWVRDVDLILTEGYKRARYPKIEVSLFKKADSFLCTEEDSLVAVVSNQSVSIGVPVFREDELGRLSDFLEETFLKRPGGA
jgi:molybdopterin-guanine dinucleotide biosynthesis protein B